MSPITHQRRFKSDSAEIYSYDFLWKKEFDKIRERFGCDEEIL
jgi:GrpB-like predicted nucleotidyltransferase (UPF0157 family)